MRINWRAAAWPIAVAALIATLPVLAGAVRGSGEQQVLSPELGLPNPAESPAATEPRRESEKDAGETKVRTKNEGRKKTKPERQSVGGGGARPEDRRESDRKPAEEAEAAVPAAMPEAVDPAPVPAATPAPAPAPAPVTPPPAPTNGGGSDAGPSAGYREFGP